MNLEFYLKKIRILIFYTIIFIIPFVFNVNTTDVHFLIKSIIFRILIVICTAITIYLIGSEKTSKIPKEPFILIMLTYFLIGTLSYFNSISNFFFLKKFIQILSFFLLIFNFNFIYPTLKQLRIFIYILIGVALVVTALGIPEFWGHYLIDFKQYGFSMPIRCASTLGNPNFAMEYMNIIIPLSIAMFFFSETLLSSSIYGIIFLIFSIYVVLSRCRAGWIAFIIMIIISQLLLLFNLKKNNFINKKKMKFIAIAIIVVLLFLLSIPQVRRMAIPNFQTIFSTKFSSNAFRLLAWRSTLKMIKAHPFLGIGWGNFEPVYPKYRNINEMIISGADHRVGKAHNDFLQEFAEIGIVGFSVFIFMFFYIMRKCILIMKEPKNRLFFYLSYAFFLSYCATIITAFFGSSLQMPVSSIFLWFITGFLVSIYQLNFSSDNYFEFTGLFKKILKLFSVGFLIIPFFLSRYIISNYYLRIGLGYLSKHKPKECLINLDNSHKYNSLDPETVFYLGMCHANLGDYKNSIKYYKYFMETQPYFAECANNIGVGYDNLKDYKNAEKYYRKAIKLKPNFSDAYNNLGAVLNVQRKHKESLESYKMAVKYNKYHFRAINNIGIALSNQGKKEEAKIYFEKALKINPNFLKAIYNLGNYYSEKGNWKKVSEIYSRIKDSNFRKNYAFSLYKNGLVYYQTKKFKEAYRIFKLSAYLSGFSEQYFYLSCSCVFLNRLNEALNFAKASIQIKNDYIPAYILTSSIYKKLKDNENSKLYYNNALNFSLDQKQKMIYSNTLYRNGSFYHSVKDYEFSLLLLKYAVFINKKQDYFNNLIVAYIETHDLKMALKTCNEAIKYHPKYYKFYVNRAIVYERSQNVFKAINDYKFVIANAKDANLNISKKYLQVVYNKLALLNIKNKEKAIEYYKKIIKLDPNSKYSTIAKKQIHNLSNNIN